MQACENAAATIILSCRCHGSHARVRRLALCGEKRRVKTNDDEPEEEVWRVCPSAVRLLDGRSSYNVIIREKRPKNYPRRRNLFLVSLSSSSREALAAFLAVLARVLWGALQTMTGAAARPQRRQEACRSLLCFLTSLLCCCLPFGLFSRI